MEAKLPLCSRRGYRTGVLATTTLTSIAIFLAAAVCEIGGGYLIWLWRKDGRSALLGVVGAMILFVYGLLPTLQNQHFSRVYAAYGGVFVVMSLCWGWAIDGKVPDRFDWLGASLCMAGVGVIMYAPRT